MSVEQFEVVGIATHKPFRRVADWMIALVLVAGACIAIAVWLVGSETDEVSPATASLSVEAVGDARALNESAISEQQGATFTLSGVRDVRALNAEADRYLEAARHFRVLNLAQYRSSALNIAGVADARALNQAQYRSSALNIAGVEDARSLNQPAESYRFMPAGPGR
jgi:hypothetical protein